MNLFLKFYFEFLKFSELLSSRLICIEHDIFFNFDLYSFALHSVAVVIFNDYQIVLTLEQRNSRVAFKKLSKPTELPKTH